jgi:hypothetical protein
MMQATDHRECDDLPSIYGLALAELGGVLVECEVGPGAVIVNDCALDGVLRRDSRSASCRRASGPSHEQAIDTRSRVRLPRMDRAPKEDLVRSYVSLIRSR